MNDEKNLGPLPTEVESLLEHERARFGPPPEVSGRMYGRLAAVLGLPPGGGPGGPDSPDGAADPGTPQAGPGPGNGAVGLAASGAASGLGKTALVAIFAAGAVAGSVTTHLLHEHKKDQPPARAAARKGPAAAHTDDRSPQAREAAIHATPGEQPIRDPTRASAAPVQPAAPRHPSARRAERVSASRPAGVPDRQLAAEQVLVERARSALVRSQPADALSAVAQHRKAFPEGRLAEEREAIHVLALVAGRQYDRARKIAQRFRARYPKSLLLSTVETALKVRPPQAGDQEKPGNLR